MFKSARRMSVIAAALTCLAAASIYAQVNSPQPRAGAPAANTQAKVPDDLWQLLGEWEKGSARVQKIHGKHVRRAYDHTFEIEKISQGEFWYEHPDKGRMDIKPVKITQKMLADRNQPNAQVVKKKNGKPFELKSDDPSRWICDGETMYEIDDQRKEARMMVLPPQLRGTQIMNSPLPFLFGLPRDEALRRFNLTIIKDYRPTYPVVRLQATPRLSKDAKNWRQADILLDTNTYLPQAVKLLNPAGTKDTRYTFSDLEVNKNGLLPGIGILGSNPWDPKLDKSYRIQVIKEEDVAAAAKPSGGPLVPNVVGKPHDVATSLLIQAGIPAESISKRRDVPAQKAALTYTVNTQNPRAGSILKPGQKVVLMLFDKPGAAANAKQPGNVGVERSGGNRVAQTQGRRP